MRYFFAIALLTLGVTSCLKDQDFEDGKIQSLDNHGVDQNMISTAVTPTSGSEFLANAVDASTEEMEIQLIPVVITAASTASQDIHVKMVPAPDSLDSYNIANETEYVMPGAAGTPAFTLVDDGVVTIPKGSQVGYLKIRTITADYFGDIQYAFAYRIESVQEGYPISGNHNFGIVAVIPKNPYDGKYTCNITTFGWSAYGISDGVPGDYGTIALVTTGLTSNVMGNLVAGGTLQPAITAGGSKTAFGATGPVYVLNSTNNKVVDVFNSVPDDGRGRVFTLNPAAVTADNVYDPATKTYYLNYLMKQNGRPDQTILMTLVYVGPR